MLENKVYCCDWLENSLPDKSVQLIIADPPYFEVNGAFDFIWGSFAEYLQDVERWAVECKRVLADNGTLFWWGMDRKIAYSQVIFDRYFCLIGTPIWEKPSSPNEWDTRRTFPERGAERLLMYSNESNGSAASSAKRNYAYQTGMKRTEVMESLISYFIQEMINAGFDCAKINEATGTKMASHWFARTSQWSLPTKYWYGKLQELFNHQYLRREYEDLRREYEDLRREYEDLRREYEDLRRPFDNALKLTDIFRFPREISKYDHDTCKPETLTRALILTCSRPNDLVLAPFAGSGTECAMAAKEGRRFIGFDINAEYCDMANERCRAAILQPSLF